MIPIVWGVVVVAHAGAAVWFTGAPTAENARRGFVRHARETLAKVEGSFQPSSRRKREQLSNDLSFLEQKASEGWTEPKTHAAFSRVSGFLTSTHLQGTGQAIVDTVDNYLGTIADFIRKPMGQRPVTDEARHC